MIPLSWYIALATVLFAIGAIGVVARRNTIIVFMCIELMLNASNITLVAFSQIQSNLDGQVAAFFVIVIAAAEAAVGLAIILGLFRNFRSVHSDDAGELRL